MAPDEGWSGDAAIPYGCGRGPDRRIRRDGLWLIAAGGGKRVNCLYSSPNAAAPAFMAIVIRSAPSNVARLLACAALLSALAAFAQAPQVVDHAFGFDLWFDAPDSEVLDYRYGDSNLPVRAPQAAVAQGAPLMSANVRGPMLRGDSLYVKWRDKKTAEVHEDTVDLRQRLPVNIVDHKIHFVVNGAQLYIYLISLIEPREPEAAADGPRMYRSFKTITLYPEPRKP